MIKIILSLLLLPLVVLADEVRIAVGQNRDEAIALIKKNSGTDLTPHMELEGPDGKSTLKDVYWEFQDYDVIVELMVAGGKISGLTFWSKKDFHESKLHLQRSKQSVMALKLDTNSKRVSVEKKKDKDPKKDS